MASPFYLEKFLSGGQAGEVAFSQPFSDYSSKLMPRRLGQAFRWAEMIWNRMDTYRQGIQKIVRYFLTEVDLLGVTPEELQRWKKLLRRIGLQNILALIGDDFLSYGNSISSVIFPFSRNLICPRCHLSLPASRVNYRYKDGQFSLSSCPRCAFRGVFTPQDVRDPDEEHINFKRWDLHEINLLFNPITGATEHIWKIPSDLRSSLRQGERFYLDTTPIEIIRAAAEDEDLLLNRRLVKHLKIGNLAGVKTGGWGIPPILASFSQIWYTQLLRRFNEAVALDYLFPMRVLTPAAPTAPPGSGEDPLRSFVQPGLFEDKVMSMIKDRRRDPTAWFALPFPLQYGPVGGEGLQMLQPALIEQANGDLLSGQGVPMEFYRGNLRWRGDPAAIRLLEKTWEHFTSAMNDWLDWALDLVASATDRGSVDARLKSPSMFDDFIRKRLLLELAAEGRVSEQTAYEEWGINLRQETRNLVAEERLRQEEFAKAAPPQGAPGEAPMSPLAVGAPTEGGMPGGGAAAMPATMAAMHAQAEEIANYMFGLPDSLKRSQLIELKRSNRTLHALVAQKMEDLRRQQNLVGGEQLRTQLYGS